MVFAINRAWSLLKAKSCTPFCVVSDSTMISGCASGHPVAKAVTKSAEVDRLVIGRHFLLSCSDASVRRERPAPFTPSFTPSLSFGDVGRNLDFDLGPLVDQPADIEQRRRREIPPQGFLPGSTNAGACGLVFAAAGQVPGQADDMLGTGAGLRQQLHDPLQRRADLRGHVGRI